MSTQVNECLLVRVKVWIHYVVVTAGEYQGLGSDLQHRLALLWWNPQQRLRLRCLHYQCDSGTSYGICLCHYTVLIN